MILLREAELSDLNGVEALSKIASEHHPGFMNLSLDRDQWKEKLQLSNDSFSGKIKDKKKTKFIFIAEDTDNKKCVGMSMITGQHGTAEVPHFYFELGSEQKYSATISTGFIHGTLQLKYDTDGPTEIGGLLVNPEYRNHASKVGKQISFVRFLYIGAYRDKFKDKVLAELLPPLTKKGKSSLWEAVGRRFTNLDYPEADMLSMTNKEFILSLFPHDKIMITFLPADARNAIGKVSKDTEPVLHMLKRIGFSYPNQVDPFDGGPHLWAKTTDILPVKNTRKLKFMGDGTSSGETFSGIVMSANKGNNEKFKALALDVRINNESVFFNEALGETIGILVGDDCFFTTYY